MVLLTLISFIFGMHFAVINVYCTSLQNGMNAVHQAATGGHVSLVRELVDTHHTNVHHKAQVLYLSVVLHMIDQFSGIHVMDT